MASIESLQRTCEYYAREIERADDLKQEMADAIQGLLGLVQLFAARDSVRDDLSDAENIEGDQRIVAAWVALGRAGIDINEARAAERADA